MYKVQVDVPAALVGLGPGLDLVGLALNLHAHIELIARQDGELRFSINGENRESIPASFANPVLRAASRLFQLREMAPPGLDINIHNRIPAGAGLELDAALLMGGLVAANNWVEPDFEREELIKVAVQMGVKPVTALTLLMGGVNIAVGDLHKSLEPPPLRVILAVPDFPDYARQTAGLLPESVPLADAIFNMGHFFFTLDALLNGDYALLGAALQDRLYQARYTAQLPGYENAIAAGRAGGAAAVTLAGYGPALLAFAPYNHTLIAEGIASAFTQAGARNCRTWTLGLDAQGVTVGVVS